MTYSKHFQAAVFQPWLCGNGDDNHYTDHEITVAVTAVTYFDLIFRIIALHCQGMLVRTS